MAEFYEMPTLGEPVWIDLVTRRAYFAGPGQKANGRAEGSAGGLLDVRPVPEFIVSGEADAPHVVGGGA